MTSRALQFVFFAIFRTVSGLQSDQCGGDLLQLAINIQDISTVILEDMATVTYTVFERELGPPPAELGINIPPPRKVSFESPNSMPIKPSSSMFYSSSVASSISASTGVSFGPKVSPTIVPSINRLNTLLIQNVSSDEISGRRKRSSTNGPPLNIKFLFETVSKALNVTLSDFQYNAFTSAIVEIAQEYIKACKTSNRAGATINTLYDQLIKVRKSKPSNKANLLRRILAKSLCSDTRTKRQSPSDPNIYDFFHTITHSEAKNLFGFNFVELFMNGVGFPTLSFVVDTTGSMSSAIDGVKKAIKTIIATEKQNPLFYVLTPFNDYDGDGEYSTLPNYGPNVIATTRIEFGDFNQELKNLYLNVSNLVAHSGGDAPEYCMGGILETLRATRTATEEGMSYNIPLWNKASQIIVFTDATAKDESLLKTVEDQVRETGVTVSFILTKPYFTSYSPYDSIARINNGVVIRSNSRIEDVVQTLIKFAGERGFMIEDSDLDGTLLPEHHKRSAETCYTFGTSLYTSQLDVFFVQDLSLTYPNGTTTRIQGPSTYTVQSPDAGRWAMCSIDQILYSTQTDVHYTVTFLDSRFSTSENLPTVCTKGMIAVKIIDDSAKFMSPNASLDLDLLNSDNILLATVGLLHCSGTYLGNITYPEGIVNSFRLRGSDRMGNKFQYRRNSSSTFSFSADPCKSLTFVPSQSSGVVVASGMSRIFSFFLLFNAITTPVEVRISALSNSKMISRMVLMNSSVITSEAVTTYTISVNVSVGTLASGNAQASFKVQAHCGCNVYNSNEQLFQISTVVSTPTDKCGGCLNGGTCARLFGRFFCSCPSSFIGTYCQTKLS